MPLDSFGPVTAGLRKGTYLVLAILLAASLVYFSLYYWYSTVDPAFPVWGAIAYLVVALVLVSATLVYQLRRVNPRMLAFVRSLSGRLRSAVYLPYGFRMRGLVLTFDNGLVMFQEQNALAFRLFLAADGSVLRPTVPELRGLLRGLRGFKRRGSASTRKGDAWMRSELERVRTLLGARGGLVVLFEQPAPRATDPSAVRWTSVGLFFVRNWVRRPDAVGSAADDLEKLLEQARTGLALR